MGVQIARAYRERGYLGFWKPPLILVLDTKLQRYKVLLVGLLAY